uniref:Putative ovule protein n=1 Tax=Solanum chacoense TaxID=4108 RepID=A0A0V0GZN7_SOLCH
MLQIPIERNHTYARKTYRQAFLYDTWIAFCDFSFHRHILQSNQLPNFRGPRVSLLILLEPSLVFQIKLPI